MNTLRFRFGRYLLDPQARELFRDDERLVLPVSHIDCLIYLVQHRDRPVGRDELAAVVWDRADVSDVSLSHAIMRLRRLLGDTGSEQHCIRTLPRVGYRWVMPTRVESAESQKSVQVDDRETTTRGTAATTVAQAEPKPSVDTLPVPSAAPVSGRSGGRSVRFALTLLVLVAAAMLAYWLSGLHNRTRPASAGTVAAIVLPTRVDAGSEWAWLRLGLMDLIANRLREGGLVTTPSETVVSLLKSHDPGDDLEQWPEDMVVREDSLMIRPEVRRVDGGWQVRLNIRDGDRTRLIESAHGDVVNAGRIAADELLLRRGLAPPPGNDGRASPRVEETAQQINAAVLAGRLEVARRLIDSAPAHVRSAPEIALSEAAIQFFSGEYAASIAGVEALLESLPEDAEPRLRARALNRLGATYYRQGRLDESDRAFAQAIGLVESLNEPDILATAYTGRAAVAGSSLRLDQATALFGRARVLHEMGNDAFGVVRVDLNMGAIAMDRGQPTAALPIFTDAAERLSTLGIPEALMYSLRATADAQLMLLNPEAALATTARFWPPHEHSDNRRERWWLVLTRAVALTANGRLGEAEALVEELRRYSDPDADATVRSEAEALAASHALLRGDYARAADQAQSALTPALERGNRLSHASTWLIRTRALQRSGRVTEAAEDVRQMRAWADRQVQDWRLVFVILAEAEQAVAEGRLEASLLIYAQAMEMAESVGIPENLVMVGESWVGALLDSGRIEQASAISGRLAQWADSDMRVALTRARVYRALGQPVAAENAFARARQLAGERSIPDLDL